MLTIKVEDAKINGGYTYPFRRFPIQAHLGIDKSRVHADPASEFSFVFQDPGRERMCRAICLSDTSDSVSN
jgi:hypothetical protein